MTHRYIIFLTASMSLIHCSNLSQSIQRNKLMWCQTVPFCWLEWKYRPLVGDLFSPETRSNILIKFGILVSGVCICQYVERYCRTEMLTVPCLIQCFQQIVCPPESTDKIILTVKCPAQYVGHTFYKNKFNIQHIWLCYGLMQKKQKQTSNPSIRHFWIF